MWSLGATTSLLTHPPGYYWEEYGYATSHGTTVNRLTTEDLNLILSKLYRGEALSAWATDYVLKSMTIAPDWMDQALGSPLPAGTKLYHTARSTSWKTPGTMRESSFLSEEENAMLTLSRIWAATARPGRTPIPTRQAYRR